MIQMHYRPFLGSGSGTMLSEHDTIYEIEVNSELDSHDDCVRIVIATDDFEFYEIIFRDVVRFHAHTLILRPLLMRDIDTPKTTFSNEHESTVFRLFSAEGTEVLYVKYKDAIVRTCDRGEIDEYRSFHH